MMPNKLKRLRKKAAENDVEVEDLIAVAALRDLTAIPILQELCRVHRWPRSYRHGGQRVVPLGKWVDAICLYLEKGPDGLVEQIESGEDRPFDGVPHS